MTQQPPLFACYRHPDRGTYIRCQRCERPICGECMISAAVGFQCPECVRAGAKQTRQNVGPFGGLRSQNPALTTIVLIAINTAVWLAILLTGGSSSRLGSLLSLSPTGVCWSVSQASSYYPGVTTAQVCSAVSDSLWQPGVADGAYWQLITSVFTHVELLHIGMNMLALWFLGPPIEAAVGRVRFLAVYLLSGLAGSAMVIWFSAPASTNLGASGAVFGLIGALLVLTKKVGGDYRNVLMWLGINVAYTFFGPGSISWQGHLGGLLGGLAATAIIAYAPRENRSRTQLLGLIGLGVVTAVAIGARIAILA